MRLIDNCDKSLKEILFWGIFLDMKKVYVKAQQSKELRDDTKEVRKKLQIY